MGRSLPILVITTILVTLLAATTRRTSPAPDSGAGTVSGRVVDAMTGRPGVGVAVVAESSGVFRGHTGATGHFTMSALPPGAYTFRVEHDRMFGGFGQARPGSTPPVVSLGVGDTLDGLIVPLWPGSAISGAVSGADGRPQPDVVVRIVSTADDTAWREVRTDARGSYHAERLWPGSYRVVVPITQGLIDAKATTPLTTFAPDTPDPQSAGIIALGVGEHRRGVDVRLATAPAARLSGLIEAVPVSGTFFRLRLFRSRELDRLDLPDARLDIAGAGPFALGQLPRAAYVLEVERKVDGAAGMVYWPVRTPVDLRDGDATIRVRFGDDTPLETTIDVDATLARRVTQVHGLVRGTARLQAVAVVAFPASREHWVETGVGPERLVVQRPGSDGNYAIVGLPSGEYFVRAVHDARLIEWPLPYLLTRLVEGARPLTLRAGESLRVDLDVR